MSDVQLLWFECKNPTCTNTANLSKKTRVKIWSAGKSKETDAHPVRFLSYVQGERIYKEQLVLFRCQYGDIILWDKEEYFNSNSYLDPIKGQRTCNRCLEKLANEKRLLI